MTSGRLNQNYNQMPRQYSSRIESEKDDVVADQMEIEVEEV